MELLDEKPLPSIIFHHLTSSVDPYVACKNFLDFFKKEKFNPLLVASYIAVGIAIMTKLFG